MVGFLGSLAVTGFGLVAVIGVSWPAYLGPRIDRLGLTRSVIEMNNQGCRVIRELEACEDQWIHRETGLSYLPCSARSRRKHWIPAVLKLDALSLAKTAGQDYIALLDLNTEQVTKLTLDKPLPRGLNLHALDVWFENDDKVAEKGDKMWVFVNNHRPPFNATSAPFVGADSSVEIFETTLGSGKLHHVKTVAHPTILTPNNLVATGPSSFYVSNDHFDKTHWRRGMAQWFVDPAASSIVHCDASGIEPQCFDAGWFIYPNGIARGPGNILYSGSTLKGVVRVLEIQQDKSLVLLDEIAIPPNGLPIDNLHVLADGSIITANLIALKWSAAYAKIDDLSMKAPVEVWRIRNSTGDGRFYGAKYEISQIYGDDGGVLTGVTNANAHKDKLYLTGVFTAGVAVCPNQMLLA
ncbi:uncharacterized protein L969DRAFT_94569 [Mixia osmundae IAM 14324]|uniref:SMP-30/Gluconolactonase/LRE-like region domain-containing protein n=1 Tax=Mixia osmundae (strain CBS 9802 / IAM 14324 / JCM 22182 / KY 12970) TaxID=764103 RepID=G7E0X1_MIXOS|nr:uncharacterized protein L969DRAFT_94569 [Mixia osmundae IAM 14324]KEI39510.1 hypothetical protein L969DRAFT_94569 [Mixia osmundae IAM 14324]GAA96481.1 hypothetical protein E5Q_03149 [Mixia osmundae IAM 14324]